MERMTCIHHEDSSFCDRCKQNKKEVENCSKTHGYLGNLEPPKYIKEDRTVEQYSRLLK